MVSDSLLGLLLKRFDTFGKFIQDIVDTYKVLLCGIELSFSLILTDLELNDTGCFFDYTPSVFGLCREDLVYSALTYDRITVLTKTRIKEKANDILESAVDVIYLIFTFTGTVESSRYLDLTVIIIEEVIVIIESKRNLGIVHCLSGLGTVKDDIFHLSATESLNALLTENPSDGIGNI